MGGRGAKSGGGGGTFGASGGSVPAASPIANQAPSPQNTPITPGGVNALTQMSDQQLAQLYMQSRNVDMPNHLSDVSDMTQRFVYTAGLNGKPQVLDDAAFDQYLKDNNITPARRVYAHMTVYEEVGHGGSASVPQGVTEAISVDMGCVGDGLGCKETQVSICAKDSGGPYSYEVVGKLIEAAKKTGADYAVDVYPYYGSDVEATLRAGFDIRHGLIGPGVYASHGYERSHIDGVYNTLKVLCGYLEVV